MASKSYSASAPGSLMLFGEHAVLSGKPAIVCAVNKRLTVKLIPNNSSHIKITDATLGVLEQELTNLKIQEPFNFVLSAIILFKEKISMGFDLEINSNFSSEIGLGSSAAVTVATLAVLAEFLDSKRLEARELFMLSKQIIINVQGIGSGADLAASIHGGVLGYQVKPLKFIPLPLIPDLTAVYCGYKKPTKEVVALVSVAAQKQPQLYRSIFHAIHVCVIQAMEAIKLEEWQTLGKLFMNHQGLQSALGTSNLLLDTLVSQLSEQPEIFGAKISGSGLGDCVIGLGKLEENVFPVDEAQRKLGISQIPITIDEQGLAYAND